MKNAIRSLRRSPGFAALAAFLLAVGIASNLTAFNLIDPLFLRPLPVDRAHEIVQISAVGKDGRDQQLFSTILEPLRADRMLRGVCGFDMPSFPTEIHGALQSRRTFTMTGDCFATLGIRTSVGRPLRPQDDHAGAQRVAWLTDALWRGSFGGAGDVVGTQITLKGLSFTIAGVTEPAFSGLIPGFPADLIIPLAQVPIDASRSGELSGHGWVSVLARMQPSATAEQVATKLQTLEKSLLEQSSSLFAGERQRQWYRDLRITVRSGAVRSETMLYGGVARRFETPLFTLWGICAVLLLVTCINVAILFLGRGVARQPEMAVRLALGARRMSIVRLLVGETTIVVLAGAVGGAILARWMNSAVAVTAEDMFSLVLPSPGANAWLDARSAVYLAVLTLAVASALAAVAVWQGTRLSRADAWREGGRAIVGSSTRHQKVLLAAQLALTLASIAASGSFTTSIRQLYDLDLGIDTEDVTVVHLVSVPGVPQPKPPAPYYRELIQRLETLPSVAAATVSTFVPLGGGTFFVPLAGADTPAGTELGALTATVGERYFEALGMTILAGEGFRADDGGAREPGAEGTAIVSRSVAKHFGHERIVGQHIFLGERANARRLRVIGIAEDAKVSFGRNRQAAPPFVYLSVWEQPQARPSYALVKTHPGATVARADVRRILAALGRDYEDEFHTLHQSKDRALVEGRLLAQVSTAVSSLSLLLAAIGLFGLISYFVTSRTREIGVRMALGAGRKDIHARVVRELVPMMAAGTLGGVALTLAFGRVLTSLVSGFSAQAPWLLLISLTILIATAALAVLVPARRATSVDPTVALRHQ